MKTFGVLLLVAAFGCSERRAVADAKTDPAPAAPSVAPAATADPLAASDLPPGLGDLSALRDDDKLTLKKLLGKLQSVCGKPHSLEVSLRTDPGCKRSMYAARSLVKLIATHQWLPSEIEEQFDQHYVDVKTYSFDLKDAPIRGDVKAPVTIVEFSDFQCPHCKRAQPMLEQVLADFRGQVRIVFKNYPIRGLHADAAAAAAGAVAAGKQGKFWAYHDKLFATNQEAYPPALLEKIAAEVKLDVPKWKSDLEGAAATVEKDHAEGEKANVESTPSLYINGKKYIGHLVYDDLKEWIDEELNK